MFALISSTIFPSDVPVYWGSPRTCIPSSRRLEETRKTVDSLCDVGITQILLADNSGSNWKPGTEEFLKPAQVQLSNQHQFQNKGISELYLLLNAIVSIPPDTPILKISGRYHLTAAFNHHISDEDIIAKLTKQDGVNLWLSTRCYIVKDGVIFEAFLRAVLRELYGYGARIVGPRSLYRILRHSLSPHKQDYFYDDPVEAVEIAAARVVQNQRFKVRLVEQLGVQGVSADYAQRFIVE